MAVKKVLDLLREKYADKEPRNKPSLFQCSNKVEGIICSSWRPVSRVVAVDNVQRVLDRNKAKATEYGVDFLAIDTSFKESAAEAEVKWERA